MLSEDGFSVWYVKHKDVRAADYEGCVPMMEVEGIKRISERSIESRNVWWFKLFCDGDSKVYVTVKNTYCPDNILNVWDTIKSV